MPWVRFEETIMGVPKEDREEQTFYRGEIAKLTMEQLEQLRFSWFSFCQKPTETELHQVNMRARANFMTGQTR